VLPPLHTIVALLDGAITSGEGTPLGLVTDIDKYTLVLFRNTQKAPASPDGGLVPGKVSALNPLFDM
jgi:hypothetical protein